MITRLGIAFAAALAVLALAGTGAAAGASADAAGPPTGAAACNVQHGEWYTKNGWRKVDVYNECATGKYVCVDIPNWPDWGPHLVPGRTTETLTYGWAYSVGTGRSLYYAKSSRSC